MSAYTKAACYIAAPVLSMMAVYGLCSFVLWEADASQWSYDARFICAVYAVAMAGISLYIYHAIVRGDI